MTSVGYGGEVTSTVIGRLLALIGTIVGAFLLSLAIAIVIQWFVLEERKVSAINQMILDKKAAVAVRTAFQYNVARGKRYRLLYDGNELHEYVPTQPDLQLLRYTASQGFLWDPSGLTHIK